jgi:hypothetical protein
VNRGTIRSFVRRRLMEQSADGSNWDDNTVNSVIDVAYALVLKQVRKVDPEAVLFWDQRDTVAGTSWYAKPAGTRGPVEVGFKGSAADADWTALKRKSYKIARDWTGDPVYCHGGEYIGIFPAPTTSVVGGIQFIHAPTDSFAVDTDVPRLETTLHFAIVLWAALICKGESPEDDTKDAKELQRIIGDIPFDYGTIDQGEPGVFSPDVADARGFSGTLMTSPGVDHR